MHMRAKHRRDRKPIVSKLPAPSRHRSHTFSKTVRASRCSPITVSRWLKICPIDRPRKHMCKRRRGRIPKVGIPPTPSRRRSPTLSHTVRASRHSPITVSRWLKICPIIRPRQHMCKRRCGRIPKVGRLPAPSRHYFESADSCAPVRIASSRVDPPAAFADRALAPCHIKGSRNQGQKLPAPSQ